MKPGLISKPACFVASQLCCLTHSARQGHLLTGPGIHHCQESHCLQISTVCLLYHQPTSVRPTASARPSRLLPQDPWLGWVTSSPLFTPTRPYSVSLSDIYPFPALNYIVLHLLLRGRWWSELARCHQQHRTRIGGVHQCVFYVIQLIF